MQMEEASEHRPGDYGRWESSLWSPWHRRQTFWASLFFPSAVVALSLSLSCPDGGREGRGGRGWRWWGWREGGKEEGSERTSERREEGKLNKGVGEVVGLEGGRE